MGGSACPFGRFSGIAADPPVFFCRKTIFPLDFSRNTKYNYLV